MAHLEAIRGDITRLTVDAIVNAANTSLLGGGGVDGAIHRAAGKELLRACEKLGGCPTGSAKATPGFNLPAKWVFHAVGPVWSGGSRHEDDLLAGCYLRCMELAGEYQASAIAFPAISTGVYRFPRQRAAEIAIRTVREHLQASGAERVIFCCFDEETAVIYEDILYRIELRPCGIAWSATPEREEILAEMFCFYAPGSLGLCRMRTGCLCKPFGSTSYDHVHLDPGNDSGPGSLSIRPTDQNASRQRLQAYRQRRRAAYLH